MALRLRRTGTCVAYRIADARHPIVDGTGAQLIGGRWNSPGHAAIYAAASYAGAMSERLGYAGTDKIAKNQKVVVIRIPARLTSETWATQKLPGGSDRDDNVVSARLAISGYCGSAA